MLMLAAPPHVVNAGLHAVYDPVTSHFTSAKTRQSNCVWLEFVLHPSALQESLAPLPQYDLQVQLLFGGKCVIADVPPCCSAALLSGLLFFKHM